MNKYELDWLVNIVKFTVGEQWLRRRWNDSEHVWVAATIKRALIK